MARDMSFYQVIDGQQRLTSLYAAFHDGASGTDLERFAVTNKKPIATVLRRFERYGLASLSRPRLQQTQLREAPGWSAAPWR